MIKGSLPLAVLLDEWLDERQSDRGLAANTEAACRSDVRVLAARMAGPGTSPAMHQVTAEQLTTAEIRAHWVAWPGPRGHQLAVSR